MAVRFPVSPKKQAELEGRMEKVGLREVDLEESFIRSSGPGGQNTNKAATCVRLRHVPTGVEVKAQQERTQGLNRFFARRMLCKRLEAQLLGESSTENKERDRIRKQKSRRSRRSKAKE
jgi:protein subunit release factor B